MERIACLCCPGLHDELSRIEQLTDREREVLVRLPAGLTNRLIAHELGIAERTVKAYVTQIIAKLKVSSRTRAAVVGYVRVHCEAELVDSTKVQLCRDVSIGDSSTTHSASDPSTGFRDGWSV